MRKQTQQISILGLSLALALIFGAASAHGEMYSWRTDDGGFAFTDDRDQIPARYASAAKRMHVKPLGSYERFTPQDDAAHATYATRLAERLNYLRHANAPAAYRTNAVGHGASGANRTISVATGNAQIPDIQVPVSGALGPVIVEPVNAKQQGDFRTRRVTVIRQGDETIAVVKGRPRHHNVSEDIYDEAELEAGKF